MDPQYSPEQASAGSKDVLVTPSIRHFARQNGVDLAQLVPGSGKARRVEKRDVESVLVNVALNTHEAPSDGDVIVELGRRRHGM
jgi:2-oxoisovalerate dehydrogenase E2 component (dihydrolipoyl transacylase)